MKVNYSGWTAERGAFSCDIFVDETKTDYVINYQSGRTRQQSTPFGYHTHDWNHDGDVYTLYGAFFDIFDRDGNRTGGVFMTVEDMVYGLAQTVNGDTFGVDDPVVSIPGIYVPSPEKRMTLDEKILRSEKQQFAQDAERNRKMKMLGIRDPREPWAR